MALVSVRISLPPAIHIGIVNFNVPPPWTWDAPPPWLILAWILSVILAIAGAWIFAGACRWFCRYLRFSDDTKSRFFRPGRTDSGLVGFMCIGWPQMERPHAGGCPAGHRAVLPWPVGTLNILRWLVGHVELSSSREFSFLGTYVELLQWEILLALSVLTIIGWAWVLAAMCRWMARKHARGRYRPAISRRRAADSLANRGCHSL